MVAPPPVAPPVAAPASGKIEGFVSNVKDFIAKTPLKLLVPAGLITLVTTPALGIAAPLFGLAGALLMRAKADKFEALERPSLFEKVPGETSKATTDRIVDGVKGQKLSPKETKQLIKELKSFANSEQLRDVDRNRLRNLAEQLEFPMGDDLIYGDKFQEFSYGEKLRRTLNNF